MLAAPAEAVASLAPSIYSAAMTNPFLLIILYAELFSSCDSELAGD